VSQQPGISGDGERQARMADAVRQIVTRRERAPRSPRLERALKRLIWRYTVQPEDHGPGVLDRTIEQDVDTHHG
jgi:hypothetical protein